MDNKNELEMYALFLEDWGKTGLAPVKITTEQIISMKDWEFPFKYKINSRIKDAYVKFDNKELVRLLYILMGYHYLEKFNYGDRGYYYGSPTFMQEQNLKTFDPLISDFLIEFIKYNGGNYYFKPYDISTRSHADKEYNNYFDKKINEIINRDLEAFIVKEKGNYNKYNEASYGFDFMIRNNQAYVEPARKKVKDAERRIEEVEYKKLILQKKIDKLESEKIHLKARLQHAHSNLNRMIFIDKLRKKESYEIVENIAQSGFPLDYFEPLADKVTIKEVENLPAHLFGDFIKQARKIGKKSKFKKLYKELIEKGLLV